MANIQGVDKNVSMKVTMLILNVRQTLAFLNSTHASLATPNVEQTWTHKHHSRL